MNLVICKDKLTCGAEAAKFGAEKIRKAIAEQGECRIILATGASQFEMLSALLKEEGIDWSKVTMFHLDEYVGLPYSHPASFRKYLMERFVEKLPVKMKEVNLVEGDAADLKGFIAGLGKKIAEKPIDVCFIGIGENGHIAFNDPHVADFNDPALVKAVSLDEKCRQQQVNDGCFKHIDEVPKYAMTLTVPMLIRLLLYRLCLDISSGFSEFLGIRGAARMFSAFKSGMDALIAVFALCSVLFLLQSVLFLYAGVAIL